MNQPKYLSAEHECYSRWKSGGLTDQEFRATMGMLISSKSELHAPVRLPQLPELLASYINARTSGLRQRDSDFHRKTAEWVMAYADANHENLVRMRVLVWARESLLTVSAKEEAQRAQAMLDRFTELKQVSVQIFQKAMKAVEMDSDARSA